MLNTLTSNENIGKIYKHNFVNEWGGNVTNIATGWTESCKQRFYSIEKVKDAYTYQSNLLLKQN